jgi:glycosyltransferase involved in cell wall biosynthesis
LFDLVRSFVSIIIPAFNSAITIKRTIDSIISQDYQLWEAVIIDDGSTDGTLSILQFYSNLDQRIKFFERNVEPKGASSCRNIGIEKATGDYLVFLDSDDLLAPWCVSERIKIMQNNPQLDFTIFRMLGFYNSNEPIVEYYGTDNGVDPLIRFLSHDLPWLITCPIWKRRFLIELGGFDSKYFRLNDPELHTRALLKSNNYKTFFYLKEDCYYRIGEKFLEPSPEFIERHFFSCLYYLKDMPKYIDESILINDKDQYKSYLKTFLLKTIKSAVEWNQMKWAYKLLRIAKEKKLINSIYLLRTAIYINIHYLSYVTGFYNFNFSQKISTVFSTMFKCSKAQ